MLINEDQADRETVDLTYRHEERLFGLQAVEPHRNALFVPQDGGHWRVLGQRSLHDSNHDEKSWSAERKDSAHCTPLTKNSENRTISLSPPFYNSEKLAHSL